MTQPKPLDRQVAEQQARSPTIREATRSGAGRGLRVGTLVVPVSLIWSAWSIISDPARSVQNGALAEVGVLSIGAIVGMGVCVVVGILMAQLTGAVTRWRRRAALRLWFPDRAA